MKKISSSEKIDEILKTCKYADILRSLQIPLFLIEYEPGESVSNYEYFQIIISGNLSVLFIRNDGSTYSLSNGGQDYIIGEMNLLTNNIDNVIAEATSKLITIAIDINAYKDKLLSSVSFLHLVSTTLADKMCAITNNDAASASLSERIINYMKFKCEGQTLYGIEKASFRLHCSPRQLQRILNQFEKEDIVTKIGKGRYTLNK